MLLEGERRAPAQSPEWNSWSEGSEAAGTADELEREERLEVALEGEKAVSNFCFTFAEFGVRLTRRGERNEVQRLMDVMFDVFFDAKVLCSHVKRAEKCECLPTEDPYDALRRKKFQKEKPGGAGESPYAIALLSNKSMLNVPREKMLSTASVSFF